MWVLLDPLLTRAGTGARYARGRRVSVYDCPIDEREEGPAMNLRSCLHHRGRMSRRGALDRSGVTDPRLRVVAELRRAATYAETATLLARRAER
jgi:hypothetical protein